MTYFLLRGGSIRPRRLLESLWLVAPEISNVRWMALEQMEPVTQTPLAFPQMLASLAIPSPPYRLLFLPGLLLNVERNHGRDLRSCDSKYGEEKVRIFIQECLHMYPLTSPLPSLRVLVCRGGRHVATAVK